MRLFERWSLHVGTLLTGLSGLIYGWMRYFGKVQGEFGIEPHPLQGLAQHLHVLAAPLLLFALGMMVRGHLYTKLKSGNREGRRTGIGLGILILPMVAAGYLVQVVTSPTWRLTFAWVHGVASLLFLIGYLRHGLRAWRKPQAGEVAPLVPPIEARDTLN
jgi:MFS family permease